MRVARLYFRTTNYDAPEKTPDPSVTPSTTPSKSSGSSATPVAAGKGTAPKTGDSALLFLAVGALVASAGAAVVATSVIRRRRQ